MTLKDHRNEMTKEHNMNRILIVCTILIFSIFNIPIAALAKISQKPKVAIETSLVMDMQSGKILHARNSKTKIFPASLTKLMTLYLTFEAIESGKYSMDKRLYVSHRAQNMKPSKLGLKEGESISVGEAILALIVKSANDAAVVLAENIANSETQFVHKMNARARQLGMNNTRFSNASGWHHPEQQTTALDMAKLTVAIKKHYAKFYPLFSKTSFSFKGNIIKSHNKVTKNYYGAEGMKTGFTSPAGYNLVTTASRNNKRLIAIVTGSKTAESRDSKMVKLLDIHFDIKSPLKNKKPIRTASRVKLHKHKKKQNIMKKV
jgi:D-alanyl-D-alanine carboxypeptidase (penicillin-binding protein 5/6)